MIVAVVPTAILRRWDVIAAAQLCEAASRLAAENERLEIELRWADQAAASAENQLEACRGWLDDEPTPRLPIGLMQNGQIVRLVSAELTP